MCCPLCNSPRGKTVGSFGHCADCKRTTPLSSWKDPPIPTRVKRKRGSHGYKKTEQQRLGTTGSSHESEHAIGYDVLAHDVKRGGSSLARELEDLAPAYQENKDDHRAHIGTGNHSNFRGTGDSSDNYRHMQGAALRSGRASNAVQLNQLFYAHQPGFQVDTPDRIKADQSFRTMADEMDDILYFEESEREVKRACVDRAQRAEMNLARLTARTGAYPSLATELAEMKQKGIIPSVMESLPVIGPTLFTTADLHGIPLDGNCLFHSIWSRLYEAYGANMGGATAQTLRQEAVGFLRHDPDVTAAGIASAPYLERMVQSGVWGGGPEIMALAQVWGVRITIVAPGYKIVVNESATTRFDIYYDGVGHYSTGTT